MSDGADGELASVTTHVPAYQKSAWVEHAEALGMSQSEYVRTMVQAGRRDFSLDGDTRAPEGDEGSTEPTEGGADLDERVVALLETGEHRSWEELVAGLTDGIEDRLEAALDRLQRQNRVQHSGRHGGYVLAEGEDGR